MKSNKMFKRTALSVAVGTAFAVAGLNAPVYAQSNEETAIEEVVVTGSRIRNLNLQSYAPVATLDREEIVATGITDIGDLIRNLPGFSGSPIGTTTNNGGNGSVQVDLRGLGEVRTLVLIDGVRTVEGNDFQTIPSAMIEKIEILKEGAAAIYGADAVSGVVNVITRRNIEGVEFSAQTTSSIDVKEDNVQTYSIAAGRSFDQGSFQFIAELAEQEGAFQEDYPYDFFQDSFFIYDADESAQTFYNNGIITTAQDIDDYSVILIGSSRVPGGNFRLGEDAVVNGVPFTAGTRLTRDLQTGIFREYSGSFADVPNDTYNYAPVNYIQTPYQKLNLYTSFNYELYDGINLKAKMRYNDRISEQILAPVPYNSGGDPSYEQIQPGVAISGDNFYNVLGVDVDNAARRMVERDRKFTQEVDQFQMVTTVDGSLFNNSINWDVNYSYGKRNHTDIDEGQLFGPHLALGLGPSFQDDSGNIICGTIDNPIPGCVSVDFFSGPGGVTDEQYNYIATTLIDNRSSEQRIFNANFFGEYEVTGINVGWAAGYENRVESFRYSPDSNKLLDQVTGNTGAGTDGSSKVDSLYGELGATVFESNSMSLDINVGFRYDNFDSFGGNTSGQYKIKYQALPGLVFRANHADVFRAPGIGELFAGLIDSFPTAIDPCGNRFVSDAYTPVNCPSGGTVEQADTQLLTRVGGNPNLEAEQGTNQSIGVIYEPSFLEGFDITLDYWSVELDDGIAAVTAQGILDFCHRDGNASACEAITRRSDNTVESILSASLNLTKETAKGLDIELNYDFTIDPIDTDIKSSISFTHLLERTFQPDPTQGVQELAGTFSESFGDNFVENKMNISVKGIRGPLSVSYLVEYIGALEYAASFTGDIIDLDAQVYHDLTANYEVTGNISISGGILNFTNEPPPFIDAGFNASTDPSTYREEGTSYFVRISLTY